MSSTKSSKSNKSKKGKRDKKNAEKIYKILTPEEQEANEAHFQNRISNLKACTDIIDEAVLALNRQYEKTRNDKEWETYLRCDGLPLPEHPWDVGKFFAKLRYYENRDKDHTINWMLDIDEHSFLTQNSDIKDNTKRTLAKEKKPNFGLQYDINICKALEVLNNIYYFYEDEEILNKIPYRILEEIVERQPFIHREINEFFNRLTYRLLCSEEAYMNYVDATTAEYCYEGKYYSFHLWTIKTVPFDFKLSVPSRFLVAELYQIKCTLEIPFSILEDNLTIRAIHTTYDHFSEYAKSFEAFLSDSYSEVPSLADVLTNERNMEKDLQDEVRNSINLKRAEYEEKVALLEAELAEKSKNKNEKKPKKKKGGGKLTKVPKEPQIILPGHSPDVSEEFSPLEDQQYKDFLKNIFDPYSLNLKGHEINMKEYLIVGGVYQFEFVIKPQHHDFKSFNVTTHANKGNLQVKKDVAIKNVVEEIPSDFSYQMSKFSRLSSSSSHALPFLHSEQTAATTNMFIIHLELPEYLCRWSKPIPCHFEADLTGYIETLIQPEAEVPEVSDVPPSRVTHRRTSTHRQERSLSRRSLPVPVPVPTSVKPDLNIAIPPVSKTLPINYPRVLPRRKVDGDCVHRSVPIFREKPIDHKIPESEKKIILDDILLDKQLTKIELRNIRRHLMPLILPSYKFPLEKFDEESEKKNIEILKQQKLLVYRRISYHAQAKKQIAHIFSQYNQRNPERIFPIFAKLEYTNAFDELKEIIPNKEPETLFELMAIFKVIKEYVMNKYLRTASVNFKSKIKFKKKKIPYDKTKVNIASSTSHDKLEHKVNELGSLVTGNKEEVLFELDDEEEEEEGEDEEEDEEEEIDIEKEFHFRPSHEHTSFLYSHWTTKHILQSTFNEEENKISIITDRLGIIGFVVPRYLHFPFQNWIIEGHPEKENEVIFTLETKHIKFVITISEKGYSGYATNRETKFQISRPIYLNIEEPISEFRELKRRFREANLNIFPDQDASFYIKGGYFSEKHLACEFHIYNAIAIHASKIIFWYSDWNRLAKRRDIILNFLHCQDHKENTNQVHITPSDASFVEVQEVCSDNLDIIILQYDLTWKNVDRYADLHQLILSQYPNANDERIHNVNLICNIKNLLKELRLLSYS